MSTQPCTRNIKVFPVVDILKPKAIKAEYDLIQDLIQCVRTAVRLNLLIYSINGQPVGDGRSSASRPSSTHFASDLLSISLSTDCQTSSFEHGTNETRTRPWREEMTI